MAAAVYLAFLILTVTRPGMSLLDIVIAVLVALAVTIVLVLAHAAYFGRKARKQRSWEAQFKTKKKL